MTTSQGPFVAQAVIRGGVSQDFRRSVRAAVQSVDALGRSTVELEREQRKHQNRVRALRTDLRRAYEGLERSEEGSRAARDWTRTIGRLNGRLDTTAINLQEVNAELGEARRRESALTAMADAAQESARATREVTDEQRRENEAVRDTIRSVQRLDRSAEELRREQLQQQRVIQRNQRQVARLNEELARTEEGSAAARKVTAEIGRMNRRTDQAARNVQELERAIRDMGETGANEFRGLQEDARRTARIFRNVALGAGAITAGIGLAVRESLQQFDRLNMVRLDFPELDAARGRELLQVSDVIGVDEGRLADIFNEWNIRAGEFTNGISDQLSDLENFGIDVDSILAIEGSEQQAIAAVRAISQLDDATQRIAAAEAAFGGSAAQAAVFIGQNAESVNRLNEAISGTPALSADAVNELDALRENTAEMRNSLDNLRDSFTLGLAPALNLGNDLIERAADGMTRFLQSNEGAAPVIAGVAGGIGLVAAAGSAAAGRVAELGEQAFFANQGLMAVGGISRTFSAVLPGLAAGIKGVTLGIWGATRAAIAFAFTPIGAAIVGITAAVALLVVGMKFLSDRVGGFGNLFGIVIQGAKAAFLTFVAAILNGFRPIGFVIDQLIEAFNRLNNLWGGQDIEFRVGRAIDRVNQAAEEARADTGRRIREGRAEQRAQQAEADARAAEPTLVTGGGAQNEQGSLAGAPAGATYPTYSGGGGSITNNISVVVNLGGTNLTGLEISDAVVDGLREAVQRG